MKKITFLMILLMMVSIVGAYPVFDDAQSNVINPEKVPFSIPSLFIPGEGEEEVYWEIGDYVLTLGREIQDASELRNFVYSECNKYCGRVTNAIYEDSQLVKLSCFYPTTGCPEEEPEPEPEYTDYRDIGESCTSYKQCGSACDNYGSQYSPRCLDGGNGRICFCGTSEGIYTTVCQYDDECPTDEECVRGKCTTENTENTGNPVELDEDDIDKIDNQQNNKLNCEDGTELFECSEVTEGGYCLKLDGTPTLVEKDFLCSLREDRETKECEEDQEFVEDCPDGSEILIAECVDGELIEYEGVCQVTTSITPSDDRGEPLLDYCANENEVYNNSTGKCEFSIWSFFLNNLLIIISVVSLIVAVIGYMNKNKIKNWLRRR